MKKREEVQFLDGLLLGGLLTGLVITLIIVFFLFHNANEVGEGGYFPAQEEVIISPTVENAFVQNDDEIGKSVVQNETTYLIESSFTKIEADLTYRSLVSGNRTLHASIWSKDGEQLLYKANNDIFTASGARKIEIKDIVSSETLLIHTEEETMLLYNLKTGIVQPK